MFKALVTISVIVLIVYAGFVFIPPYYHYYTLRSELSELARVGKRLRERELMERVKEKIEEYNVPVDEDDITITKEGGDLYIEVSWQESVNFLNVYQRTFDFSIYTGG